MRGSDRRKQNVIVGILALVIGFSGTFAWQSISQHALNVKAGFLNPGGRLHDDFNGTNKDVYVENFTTLQENGEKIFARVRLREYMEIGEEAGKNLQAEQTGRRVTSVNEGAVSNNKNTWAIYKQEDTSTQNKIRNYFRFLFGGETVYMPTFNKNKDSLSADINGTYEGTDKNPDTGTAYDDYRTYIEGEEVSKEAYYDADDNSVAEPETLGIGDTGTLNTNHTKKMETHRAKRTLRSEVISMQEWKTTKNRQPGPYWVYDVDGWAYWAQAITPDTATGLLLSEVQSVKSANGKYYYMIDVQGQFATADDMGNQGSGDGFFQDGFTQDGQDVMNAAKNEGEKRFCVDVTDPRGQVCRVGNTVVDNPTNITVTGEGRVELPQGEVIHVQPGTTAVINKQAGANKGDTTLARGGNIVLTGSVATGGIQLPANTVVKPNGTSELPSSGEVRYPQGGTLKLASTGSVNVTNNNRVQFPQGGKIDRYGQAVLTSSQTINLPQALQMKLKSTSGTIGVPDGTIIDHTGAITLGNNKRVSVPTGEILTTKGGGRIKFTSGGNVEFLQGGKITADSVITVNADASGKILQNVKVIEVGQTLEVDAPTNSLINQDGSITTPGSGPNFDPTGRPVPKDSGVLPPSPPVEKPPYIDDINRIPANSTETVTIDGIEWYILEKNGYEVLLWAKNPVAEIGNRKFDDNNLAHWDRSTLRNYLNTTWLPTKTELNKRALEKNIYTLKFRGINERYHDLSRDKVFVLSEADVFGTLNSSTSNINVKDYTNGKGKVVTNPALIKSTTPATVWLRNIIATTSSHGASTSAATINALGKLFYAEANTSTIKVRPALYINIAY